MLRYRVVRVDRGFFVFVLCCHPAWLSCVKIMGVDVRHVCICVREQCKSRWGELMGQTEKRQWTLCTYRRGNPCTQTETRASAMALQY